MKTALAVLLACCSTLAAQPAHAARTLTVKAVKPSALELGRNGTPASRWSSTPREPTSARRSSRPAKASGRAASSSARACPTRRSCASRSTRSAATSSTSARAPGRRTAPRPRRSSACIRRAATRSRSRQLGAPRYRPRPEGRRRESGARQGPRDSARSECQGKARGRLPGRLVDGDQRRRALHLPPDPAACPRLSGRDEVLLAGHADRLPRPVRPRQGGSELRERGGLVLWRKTNRHKTPRSRLTTPLIRGAKRRIAQRWTRHASPRRSSKWS